MLNVCVVLFLQMLQSIKQYPDADHCDVQQLLTEIQDKVTNIFTADHQSRNHIGWTCSVRIAADSLQYFKCNYMLSQNSNSKLKTLRPKTERYWCLAVKSGIILDKSCCMEVAGCGVPFAVLYADSILVDKQLQCENMDWGFLCWQSEDYYTHCADWRISLTKMEKQSDAQVF